MVVGEIGLPAETVVYGSVSPYDADTNRRYEPDAFFMCTIAKQLHRVVTVGYELMQNARGTIENLVGPHLHVVAPLLSYPAVVLYDPTFRSYGIEQRVYSCLDQLINCIRHVSWS